MQEAIQVKDEGQDNLPGVYEAIRLTGATEDEVEFIIESNHIEGEYDDQSHIDALWAWYHVKNLPIKQLNLENILRIHGNLMRSLRPDIAGRLRMVDVRVGRRICPPWQQVSGLLNEWIKNQRNARTENAIKKAHVDFEHIHPFEDGNGRTGRIIMNWQRYASGLPILVIRNFEKEDYYDWF